MWCGEGPGGDEAAEAVRAGFSAAAAGGPGAPGGPSLFTVQGSFGARACRATLLPACSADAGPLRLLETARAADVLLCVARAGAPGPACYIKGPAPLALGEPFVQAAHVLRVQGFPRVFGVLQGVSEVHPSARAAAKKRFQEELGREVGAEGLRVLGGDSAEDFRQVLRFVGEAPAGAGPHWRMQRPYLMAEGARFEPYAAGSASAKGTVRLSGYVRGGGLDVNHLVHLPGAGDFSVSKVYAPPDPNAPSRGARRGAAEGAMDEDTPAAEEPAALLAQSNAGLRQTVVRENVPDPLAGEQTWPTEEELAEAEREQKRKRRVLAPSGTSAYQAAWLDSDSEGDDEDDEDGEDTTMGGDEDGDGPGKLVPMDEAQGFEDGGAGDRGEKGEELRVMFPDEGDPDEGMTVEQRRREAESERLRRRREAEQEELLFPDELDTPFDTPARRRFAKYRGLKSFRTTAWDKRESLPLEYSKIFAFQNPKRAHKRALKTHHEGVLSGYGVESGVWVSIDVEDVEARHANEVLQRIKDGAKGLAAPYVVFGLLEHETKMSVVNFALTKSPQFQDPVPNKEELVFYTGVRMFKARPIFSSDAPNMDKHKMERFLLPGAQCVASVYAPIMYAPMPLVCFRQSPGAMGDGGCMPGACLDVVATGTLKGSDPDRLVLKKVILSGYPYKVHKKTVVVKHMFYDPSDVRWFKPVEIWTKYGRRGHIKEPVGTHGLLKAVFEGVVQQRDSICLSLYKRVYPKWPEDMSFSL